MTAEVFDEGIDGTGTTMHKKNIKVRLSKDRSIPGLVARTGVTVNLRDAYNDPRFFTEVEPATGFITRSILCMPIVSVDNILGWYSLDIYCNKCILCKIFQVWFK